MIEDIKYKKIENNLETAYLLSNFHLENLEYSISRNLGKNYLNHLYINVLNNPNSFGYVVKSNKENIGAILIVNNFKNKLNIIKVLGLLFKAKTTYNKILFLLNISINFLYNLFNNISKKHQNTPEIYLFIVDSKFRSKSIGRELLNKVLNELKIKNYSKIITSTHNDRLVNFYLQNFDTKILNISRYFKYKITTISIDI